MHPRRLLALFLALIAAVAAVGAVRTAPPDTSPAGNGVRATPTSGHEPSGRTSARTALPTRKVSAPVRITDAATVRLLQVGDHVDVITPGAATAEVGRADRGDGARTGPRVIARDVPVEGLPAAASDVAGEAAGGQEGALVVLRVSRRTATELTAAAAEGPLAVTLM